MRTKRTIEHQWLCARDERRWVTAMASPNATLLGSFLSVRQAGVDSNEYHRDLPACYCINSVRVSPGTALIPDHQSTNQSQKCWLIKSNQ